MMASAICSAGRSRCAANRAEQACLPHTYRHARSPHPEFHLRRKRLRRRAVWRRRIHRRWRWETCPVEILRPGTVTDCPARQKRAEPRPEFATCSVWFSSFQSAKSMSTYCESRRRSWKASFSAASMAAGARLLLRRGTHNAADQAPRTTLPARLSRLRRRGRWRFVPVRTRGSRTDRRRLRAQAENSPPYRHERAPAQTRQQSQLHFARHGDVAFQLLFLRATAW